MKVNLKQFLRAFRQISLHDAHWMSSWQSTWRLGILLLCLLFVCASGMAQEAKGSATLRGQVTDPTGAVVVGAEVSIATAEGPTRKTVSDSQGKYVVRGLSEGSVTLRATAPGFAPYEMPNVIIRPGETQEFEIELGIPMKHEQITVQGDSGGAAMDVSPENNASALVLKGEDLAALPDDPDELQQDLLALAGPSVGPNGGQIYIDGFSGGALPPKSSIREIRINQNPFSAEYDKPGYGRVEVFTKPGTDKWHGQAMFNENHSVFNSRNPYALGEVPDYHSEIYNGSVSGALRKNLSIFLNAERRNISELGVVAAIPDVLPEGIAVPSPRRRNNLSGRIDWQVTPADTITARYQFESNDQDNLGIGGITLPSRGYSSNETEHTVQISNTHILSPRAINETRFQFIRNESSQTANPSGGAAINVLGEFNAGGSTVGRSRDVLTRYELQNLTSWALGKHFVKFGGRLRAVQDTSLSQTNFNGTLTYSTRAAYLSGNPSQLSFISGSPRNSLTFADLGVYAEDDWKLRPNLTFSYGLRFESQSAISDKADLAPRVVLSWAPGAGKSAPKTVLRFGYGIFYDRFTEDLVLQAQRLNGLTQTETIANSTSNAIQCPPGTLPPGAIDVSQCVFSGTSSPTIYQINPRLRSPYTMQTAVSLERQLGKVGSLSVTYLNSRGVHQFILENINAPLPGEGDQTRPFFSALGTQNIYEYNSAAVFRQNQIITNVQLRVSKKISLMGYYTLNWANSNTGGSNSSPSNQYDLGQDYGRANFDVRHRLFLSGSASLAHNIRISPFVLINSGAPFNITTGQDNGDTFFNERPSFGVPGAPNVITTPYGSFNVNPSPGERPIPINYGRGPANATVNVRLSKTFGFGAETGKADAESDTGAPQERPRGGGGGRGPRGGPPGGGFGSPRGMGGLFSPSNTNRRFNLTLTVVARNIFNFWNPGTPIGNLTSTNFGKSVSLAGGPFSSGTANRRVDFQAMFAF